MNDAITPPSISSRLAASHAAALELGFGLVFADLYSREGLLKLDRRFLEHLRAADPGLASRLAAAREKPDALVAKDESGLLIELAPALESFVADLFGIAADLERAHATHVALAPLYAVKRQFVQRRAGSRIKPEEAQAFDGHTLEAELRELFGGVFDELTYAQHVTRWLEDEARYAREIDLALRYAAWALHTQKGRQQVRAGVLFKAPAKTDSNHLLRGAEQSDLHGAPAYRIRPGHLRRREGFALTDPGATLVQALDEAHYCIECHPQGKDSCSKGLREKPSAASSTTAPQTITFKKSALGVTLAGCPLEEKISEFLALKSRGLSIGALATIVVDNPMVAATGHRICNDCMKSCIYQKQEPVNIPQAETRTLKDVLALPWGFEIYSLLTRWNPLNFRRPLPLANSGYRVLVTGMGPAGYSLAHLLMNDGHSVAGIEGLKIEPLPSHLSGVAEDGSRVPFMPVRDADNLFEALDERTLAGFGGVAEYGITARWDKNFLKLVRLLLERRDAFALYGGVRLGSTVSLDDALELGFDHVALAMGAGKPTTLDIPNGLARGVRTASDFLMALQLTGAAKKDSIANMQMRLPVIVIGGGLTAIDAATESLAYYVVQVEKFLVRYEALAGELGEDAIRKRWDAEERETAEEFLSHARAIHAERRRAAGEKRAAKITELLQGWGGATIAYRRRMIDSPSYTLNHEEVEKALEEGVVFAEGLTPLSIEVDDYGAASAVRFRLKRSDTDGAGELRLPARSVFIAAGTQPNTVLAREDGLHFPLDGKYFRACDESGQTVKPVHALAKPGQAEVLLTKLDGGRFISFFGDLHPSYFGNVVKALASAKQGYPVVSRVLQQMPPADQLDDRAFFGRLDDAWRARVHEIRRLTPTIVEAVIRAPAAARRFQPGQFYRLQNFETNSPLIDGTRMQMEGLALTGAWVDREAGLVSTIVLEMGGSSDLCARLKPGEPVVLMGPIGTATHIAPDETVLLAGGGLGNAVLFSIGQAYRQAGSRVLYFAGYKKVIDRYKVEEIEAAADVIVWCCDEAPGFAASRPQDLSFIGNIVQAMEAYASGRLGATDIRMDQVDRVIAIGSDRMMAAVARARHAVLAPYLKATHLAIASINSPMQCMMKEICAQCLQPQRDPVTGETSYVFSCFNQDQELDRVDFQALSERLKQNSLQEKMTAQWIARCHNMRSA